MDTEELLSLSEEVAEVTRLLAADDLPAAMNRFVHRVVATVPDADAALVTAPVRGGFDTVAGTWRPVGRRAAELGPIGDVLVYGEPRRIDDVTTDRRWPRFSAQLAAAGFASALSLPLAAAGDDTAALTLLSRDAHGFRGTSYDITQLFATYAGPVLDNAGLYSDSRELVGQLRTSLQSRSVIGQAQGLIMAADDADSEESFAALRAASQRRNVKLRVLAEEIVAAHEAGRLGEVAAELGLPHLAAS